MNSKPVSKPVLAWSEMLTLPTYGIGDPNPNPMFLEKRVYQGSSGAVYPYPVIDKIADTPGDRTWTAVFLENEILKLMILPELGGRLHYAIDKTNGYRMVYHNQVIKPALVGLTGPWISGALNRRERCRRGGRGRGSHRRLQAPAPRIPSKSRPKGDGLPEVAATKRSVEANGVNSSRRCGKLTRSSAPTASARCGLSPSSTNGMSSQRCSNVSACGNRESAWTPNARAVPTRLTEIGSTSPSTRTRSRIRTPNPYCFTQTPERLWREGYVFIQPKTTSNPRSPGSGARWFTKTA